MTIIQRYLLNFCAACVSLGMLAHDSAAMDQQLAQYYREDSRTSRTGPVARGKAPSARKAKSYRPPTENYCFDEAGRAYGIAPFLLQSISNHESRHNQSALNRNSDGTYDVGHMQINSDWRGKLFAEDRWRRIVSDRCENTKAGAEILADCISRLGYSWQAIGCYNANREGKRKAYAWLIYDSMRSISRSMLPHPKEPEYIVRNISLKESK